MKIAVIAADGRLGRAFVATALAAGHSVQAGVRSGTLALQENLVTMQCNATNPDDVHALIEGQDVVVSCIGHVKNSPKDVQTVATKTVIESMNQAGLKRFVTVTGTGVRFPNDKITFVDRLLNASIELIDPARIRDGRDHVKLLQASDLDWTVIRVLKLQNVAEKPFVLNDGPTKWYVGRSEVALAMLQVIQQNSFIKQSPIISQP